MRRDTITRTLFAVGLGLAGSSDAQVGLVPPDGLNWSSTAPPSANLSPIPQPYQPSAPRPAYPSTPVYPPTVGQLPGRTYGRPVPTPTPAYRPVPTLAAPTLPPPKYEMPTYEMPTEQYPAYNPPPGTANGPVYEVQIGQPVPIAPYTESFPAGLPSLTAPVLEPPAVPTPAETFESQPWQTIRPKSASRDGVPSSRRFRPPTAVTAQQARGLFRP